MLRNPHEIQAYAQIVHLYYMEGILSKEEVKSWIEEFDLDFHKVDKYKIVFTYYDEFYPSRMTLYKSGRVIVESEGNEPI